MRTNNPRQRPSDPFFFGKMIAAAVSTLVLQIFVTYLLMAALRQDEDACKISCAVNTSLCTECKSEASSWQIHSARVLSLICLTFKMYQEFEQTLRSIVIIG